MVNVLESTLAEQNQQKENTERYGIPLGPSPLNVLFETRYAIVR